MASKRKHPDMMERARAARAIVESQGNANGEILALQGFMAIFHPEVPQDNVCEMVRDIKKR